MSDLIHDALSRGVALVERGQVADGLRILHHAATDVDADPRDYDALMNALRRAYVVANHPRGVSTIAWYLGDSSGDRRLFEGPPPVDVARTFRMLGDEARAARAFEDAGLLAHAAAARERAQDFAGARALWSRLAHRLSTTAIDADATGRRAEAAADQMYVLGLVRYDIARNSGSTRGDRSRREAIVAAVSALEEAAGRYEILGYRERAFDCYQALADIGRTTKTFEHSLEGRVNLIRILREDYLQQYAIQQYDEAIAIAEGAGEYAAAATFAREAMTYARTIGGEAEAQTFARRAIDLHVGTGRAIVRGEGPPELAENAYLAAISLAADLGLLAKARVLYEEAAQIPRLDEARRTRHRHGAEHLQGAEDVVARDAGKATSRPSSAQLEVWIVDVLEWEQQGRAEEACAEIMFDAGSRAKTPLEKARDPATAPLRRRALVARLAALDYAAANERGNAASTAPFAIELVNRLGQIVDYRILASLEAVARHPIPEVRARAVHAAGVMPFKRSAQLLRAAALDDSRDVVMAAAQAIERKTQPVFVDPLRRLARDASIPEVRIAALRALARIDIAEAADAVLTAIEAGTPVERAAVIDALRRRPERSPQLTRAAKERLAKGVSPEVARDLEAVIGGGTTR